MLSLPIVFPSPSFLRSLFTHDVRKNSDFWTPSPLSLSCSRNLSVLLAAFELTPSPLVRTSYVNGTFLPLRPRDVSELASLCFPFHPSCEQPWGPEGARERNDAAAGHGEVSGRRS